jgi:hypothetical protein
VLESDDWQEAPNEPTNDTEYSPAIYQPEGAEEMTDETISLITRHREAAHQQGVIVGIVCTGAVMIVITLIVKLMGVTCG